MLSIFNKHTQNLLKYFPSDHLNIEISKPNSYLNNDGYQIPIKEGKIDMQKNQKIPTTNYNVIMKPVEIDGIVNTIAPFENKENKELIHGSAPAFTTTNFLPKYEPLASFPNINLVQAPYNLQPLTLNTYTTNQIPEQLAPTTVQYAMTGNYLAPISYDPNVKYIRLMTPPKTHINHQEIHGQQVPQSAYDYGNIQARSPLKKITVYTHQQKAGTYENIEKEIDNLEKGTANRIIIDEARL